jgi:calcium-dependent protein kinase
MALDRGLPLPVPASRHEAAAKRSSNRKISRRQLIVEHDEGAQELEDVYDIEDDIVGEGCFGTVCRARLKSAPSVVRAVKTVKKCTLCAEKVVRQEIKVLKDLDHPRICRLLETFEDEWAIYLVLEYIDGRELFDEIIEQGRIEETQAADVLRQVLGALQYCHERSIVHRDLKPENIMVEKASFGADPGRLAVKLIDFGLASLSTSIVGRAGSCLAGTAEYLPPEARRGVYVPASDMWSIGVILHLLLVGNLPRRDVLVGSTPLNISNECYADVSLAALELLQGLLRPEPKDRLTAGQALAHPWVSGEIDHTSCGARQRPVECKTVEALKSFQHSARLRQAALTAVAMQLPCEVMAGLREQFIGVDTDGNGRISKEELQKSFGSEDVNCRWVEEMFDAIDTDGSHEIDYTEWLAAAISENELRSDQAILAAFRSFDADGDGYIDAAELSRIMAQTPEEAVTNLAKFDTNGDGVIDITEFRKVLLGAQT